MHRDIKPSNILLVDYGNGSERARARLTDFGIALAAGVERLTADGVTTGTAAYLSPEQARGADVGPASDVYSLGLVLLQCFTRRREFPGRWWSPRSRGSPATRSCRSRCPSGGSTCSGR